MAIAGSGFECKGNGAMPPGAHGDAEVSNFFKSVFCRGQGGQGGRGSRRGARPSAGGGDSASPHAQGEDHHAKVVIDLLDADHAAQRTVSLRVPVFDAKGRVSLQDRQLEVHIRKGVRAGQHLRLAGQGGAGHGGAQAGDLYLEIQFLLHPVFRIEGRDKSIDLSITPSEAALGAGVTAPTPDGDVQLNIPPGSGSSR